MKFTAPRDRPSPLQNTLDGQALFRRQTGDGIRSKSTDALRKWSEDQLGVRLPDSDISLIQLGNGGSLRMTAIAIKGQADAYTLDHLADCAGPSVRRA